jgi:cysteinyl-tRNA synthetase
MELSARMAKLYQEDVGLIGCVEPDVQPKVSEHIPEIIALIQQLVAREVAYVVDGGRHVAAAGVSSHARR